MAFPLMLIMFGCVRGQGGVPLSQGDVEIYGTLSPADISPVRRGSFLLSHKGRTVYYVESPTVHLRRFVGRELLFRGVVEPNSDLRSLPVLVVREVSGDMSSLPGRQAGSFSSASSSSFPSSSSRRTSGVPCGGEGGVLCPMGQYCAAESRETNIGRCRRVGS